MNWVQAELKIGWLVDPGEYTDPFTHCSYLEQDNINIPPDTRGIESFNHL